EIEWCCNVSSSLIARYHYVFSYNVIHKSKRFYDYPPQSPLFFTLICNNYGVPLSSYCVMFFHECGGLTHFMCLEKVFSG
ncbi:MAG: hypothetical protein OEL84_12110, partial [Nitrosopumilus sp.]|nr:hypothetical protein [Nitrosopumilus sp.]